MKKNLRYILLGFSVSLIITVVVSMMVFRNLSTLNAYNQSIEHAQQILDKLNDVRFLIVQTENLQHRFIISRDSSYSQKLAQTKAGLKPELKALRDLAAKNRKEYPIAVKIRHAVNQHVRALNEALDVAMRDKEQRLQPNYLAARKTNEDFERLSEQMQQEELSVLNEKKKQKEKSEAATPNYLFLILIVSVLFQILSFLMIMTEFRRRYIYQKQLEHKIQELNMRREELEQIAFIASHDLQEPLRKMRSFSGKLLVSLKEKLNAEGAMVLNKIDAAAQRMQGLIQDVVDYTGLINSEEQLQTVDLNSCLKDVEDNLVNLINKKNATIKFGTLPQIQGYPFQLQLLFTNLIHNSIKFSRKEIAPVIDISIEKIIATNPFNLNDTSKMEAYLLVKVKDNGIGFENEFAKKIFMIFQRLHSQTSSYEGKGIGLAICKRVMINHNGFISAESKLGEGSVFNLYFPI